MLRIGICDDSPCFLEETKEKLENWPNKPQDTVITSFSTGGTLLHAHSVSPFDIILLDVVMPLINGIETAQAIRDFDKTVRIVFLTSSSDFAVDSYSVKASNYLLKPLDANILYRCLDELLSELQTNVQRCILVKTPHATRRVILQQIEYIEVQNKHSFLVLQGGNRIESIESLSSYEHRLLYSDGFVRCHRAFIVNIYQVDSFTANEIKTRSGHLIPISRNHQKTFEYAYFDILFGKAGEIK